MALEIRPIAPDERHAAFLARAQSFNADPGSWDPDAPTLPDERRIGAFLDGTLVAHTGVWELGQWFGGRPVPMGGLAGVVTLPEHRGKGYASLTVRAAIEAMRERGEAISTLFPATVTPYRRLGWEVAGAWIQRRAPLRSLAALPRPEGAVALRRGDPGDAALLAACYDRVAATADGFVDRTPLRWQLRLTQLLDGPHRYLYVAEQDGTATGYLLYRHEERDDHHEFYGLRVHELVALDRDTLLTLWRLLASNLSMTEWLTYQSSPADPLLLLLAEQDLRPGTEEWAWMTRLVDAPAAVAARGYPPGVSAAVELDLADDAAAWNTGAWVLEVDDGEGRLEPGGSGRVGLRINELSTLYTGWASPWDLARLGRLPGANAADLRALAAALHGPIPWMIDFF